MKRNNRARVADIVTIASGLTRIGESHLYGRNRTWEYSRVRHAVIWVARQQRPPLSFPELGRLLGGRDHTTILHGLERAEHHRSTDPTFRALTDQIREIAATTPAFIKERSEDALVAAMRAERAA